MLDQPLRRGDQPDLVLRVGDAGWSEVQVVDLHAVEEISRPFETRLTVAWEAARRPRSLDELLGRPATLAIADETLPGFRLQHGLVAEAEEVEHVDRAVLYRLQLVPHVFRAAHRQRCRTFVDKPIRAIVSAVLANDRGDGSASQDGLAPLGDPHEHAEGAAALGAIAPAPQALFHWDVRGEGAGRIADAGLRPYVVQYNKRDLAFVSRLLAEEGISYLFHHTREAAIMILTDRPGAWQEEEPRAYPLRRRSEGMAGPDDAQTVRAFRTVRRMRPRSVAMRDYDWRRSGIVLEGRALRDGAEGARPELEHFEFPARDESIPGTPCMFPARLRLERFETEGRLAHALGNVRGLRAGRRFRLVDEDGQAQGEQLVVRIETVATQHHYEGTSLDDEPFGFDGRSPRRAPSYANRFASLETTAPYRPEIAPRRPRIDGVQTALITQHEGAAVAPPEIHCDDWGCVRVRFPWDQRADGTPSSSWIRVSQGWAGAGFGALFTPRVGQEVLVAYLDGDPERPTVVGRVYNARNPLPVDVERHPERSTVRSRSTPENDGFNELRFDDRAGAEEMCLHAQKDFVEAVRHDHTCTVGRDEHERIGRDHVRTVGGAEALSVTEDQTVTIEGAQTHFVGEDRTHTVHGAETVTITGNRTTTIETGEVRTVGESCAVSVGGNHALVAGGSVLSSATTDHRFDSDNVNVAAKTGVVIASQTAELTQSESLVLSVGEAKIEMRDGLILIDNGSGASVSLVGGVVLVRGDAMMRLDTTGELTLTGSIIHLNP